MKVLSLQAGRQQQAGSSPADIVIYGGSAGGGKSFWLLTEAARHHAVSGYVAKIFRRTYAQVAGGGGLWDETFTLYNHLQGKANSSELSWQFPSGAKVGFGHLQHEKDKYSHQGKQYAFIGFDEADHFEWSQIWYLYSRNRSTCGVRPVMKMTVNPNPSHPLKDFIAWWLDDKGQFPNLEKAGVIRWFVRDEQENILWHDTDTEEFWRYTDAMRETVNKDFVPPSVTFIPASVDDNPALLKKDPGYKSRLMSLPRVERQRLLYGDWLTAPSAGLYFKREWFNTAQRLPKKFSRFVRAWDLAGSNKKQSKNSKLDYAVGALWGVTPDKSYYILDVQRLRGTPAQVKQKVLNTANADREQWGRVTIKVPQDPGQAGADQVEAYNKLLAGHVVKFQRPTGSKITRAEGFSSQVENGNVWVVQGAWNDALFTELEQFPDGDHDDQVDANADAFNEIVGLKKIDGAKWLS